MAYVIFLSITIQYNSWSCTDDDDNNGTVILE